jgi:hypothetical protein
LTGVFFGEEDRGQRAEDRGQREEGRELIWDPSTCLRQIFDLRREKINVKNIT